MTEKNPFGNVEIPREIMMLKKHLWKIVVVVLLVFVGFSSLYTVGPEEVGVVLQFGKYNRTTQPGLNYKIPIFEEVFTIPVERQLKQEFGFRTEEVGVRSRYATANLEDETLMLTGDLNLAEVEWVVQYRINDPYLYLFRVRNAEKTLRDMSESIMRKVVGDRTVNEVLTVGRQQVATEVEVLMQQLCDEYELGIAIDQVVLQDVNPPDPVKSSFNAVNEAQQQRETLINRALAEYNQVIPRARGEAQELIEQAEGYAINRVNRSQGEADRFTAVYEEYIQAPQVTRKRLYLETMERLLPEMGEKIIIDENSANVLPLLQLGQTRTGGID